MPAFVDNQNITSRFTDVFVLRLKLYVCGGGGDVNMLIGQRQGITFAGTPFFNVEYKLLGL